jgi:hypothetical protein
MFRAREQNDCHYVPVARLPAFLTNYAAAAAAATTIIINQTQTSS